jgi:very-short-patch-repair endonuclease
MRNDPETAATRTVGLAVRGIRCRDPYSKWFGDLGTNSNGRVIARLFWRKVPLQTNAVQGLVRATAAALLPRVDEWDLFPARPWLTTARSLAGAGLLPVPSNYEPAANLVEFRRLLPNDKFRIRAGIGSEASATEEDVPAVERILQWACDFLEADALVFLPLREEEESQGTSSETPDVLEPEIIAPPVRGKPHPLSDSEQKLAKLIVADSFLAPLFSFNTPVHLSPLSRPCVDLVWEAGRLVVEIDDATHWHKVKYAADRQRDFELIAAGFMVLRITAEEVLQDAGKALHKIRTCVELRRQP